MGKRELFIATAFGTLALMAWWLAAPPVSDGARPLSFDTLAEIWRNRNPNAPASRVSVTTSGALPVSDDLAEIRLANTFAVDILGSDRDDLAWTLAVEGTGRTEAQARERATAAALHHDDMGTVLAVAVRGPQGPARLGSLMLAIPSRLGVRIESARRARATHVAAVRLENLAGDVELHDIDGPVEGGHRSGSLVIDDPADVVLSLIGSTATIRRARGVVDLTVRNGKTTLEDARADVRVEGNGHDLTIVDPAGRVRTSLVGGSVTIERPRGVIDVDARRSRVKVAIDRTVAGTIFLTEGQLTLALSDPLTMNLDVAVDEGEIDASAVGLTPDLRDGRWTLTRGTDGAPTVAIRAERGSIVIVPLK